MYKEISVQEALELDEIIIIDVRSEGEFAEATIPGAVNIPILNDDERSAVGKSYRHEGPDSARRLGMSLVSHKLSEKLEAIDQVSRGKKLAVFCWRGGLRSKFMASFLDTMGYSVYRVIGGYKSYRHYVNGYLDKDQLTQQAVVLHGLTGVGKTEMLARLARKGLPALDLEGLARHRGSVFGKIGQMPSPTQKSFESSIVRFLKDIGDNGIFIVECESKRLGNLIVPPPVMKAIKEGIRVLLYAPLEIRIQRLAEEYLGAGENIERLQEAIASLTKKIGHNRVRWLNSMLQERRFDEVVNYLLNNYYDPLYQYPEGPSQDYQLSLDASDMPQASEKLYEYLQSLAYKEATAGRF